MERAWMDKFVAHGFIDTFRHFNKEPKHYTWWSLRTRARERNIGWRLDYFFVTENLLSSVTGASILSDVMGSDHGKGLGIELPYRYLVFPILLQQPSPISLSKSVQKEEAGVFFGNCTVEITLN